MSLLPVRRPKRTTIETTYRAEPPKLILISSCWVWTPIAIKIMDTVKLHCLCRCLHTQTLNNESFLISLFLIANANCPDSQERNKAKNALSLTSPISPGKAGAKIRKFWKVQAEKVDFSSKCSQNEELFVSTPCQIISKNAAFFYQPLADSQNCCIFAGRKRQAENRSAHK